MFDDEVSYNGRGFRFYNFKDGNGLDCSIQKSSAAEDDMLWIGVNDADPKILCSDAINIGVDCDKVCGYIKFPIPGEVSLNTRMHITRDQAKQIAGMLMHFHETGNLPKMSVFND